MSELKQPCGKCGWTDDYEELDPKWCHLFGLFRSNGLGCVELLEGKPSRWKPRCDTCSNKKLTAKQVMAWLRKRAAASNCCFASDTLNELEMWVEDVWVEDDEEEE